MSTGTPMRRGPRRPSLPFEAARGGPPPLLIQCPTCSHIHSHPHPFTHIHAHPHISTHIHMHPHSDSGVPYRTAAISAEDPYQPAKNFWGIAKSQPAADPEVSRSVCASDLECGVISFTWMHIS